IGAHHGESVLLVLIGEGAVPCLQRRGCGGAVIEGWDGVRKHGALRLVRFLRHGRGDCEGKQKTEGTHVSLPQNRTNHRFSSFRSECEVCCFDRMNREDAGLLRRLHNRATVCVVKRGIAILAFDPAAKTCVEKNLLTAEMSITPETWVARQDDRLMARAVDQSPGAIPWVQSQL